MSRQPENFGGPPNTNPAGFNPKAQSYAQGIQERRRAAPTYSTPVGGPPLPSIPRLDGLHAEGRTMAEQAPPPAPRGIVEPPAPGGFSPASFGFRPTDQLPPQATTDPEFRQGQGAMYASAQPKLAMKYGVIRDGAFVPPQQINPRARRSPEESAADVAKFLDTQKAAMMGDGAAMQASEQSLAGGAARVANPPGVEGIQPVTEEEREKAKQLEASLSKLDEFDFNRLRQAVMKDLLNNDEQKKLIEERLPPLDLGRMVTEGIITQKVPIIPGTFEPTFQSLAGDDDLACKRLIMQENNSLERVSDMYLLDKFSMMGLVMGLYAINTTVLPSHRDKDGNFDEELFWKKFNRITKLPYHMLASIGVNLFWFDVRVRKLFVAERVKNG